MNLSETAKHEIILFVVFNIIVALMLVIDLGLMSKKKDHTMSLKKAGLWTLLWVSVSLMFSAFIYFYLADPNIPGQGRQKSMEFISGYLLEYSLSIDNLFVFIMIFQKFKIGPRQQPDILKWGILGAVFLRAIMIGMGSALVIQFSWILYIFGGFLIYTAYKMFSHQDDDEEEFDPEKITVFRLVRRFLPVSENYSDDSGKLVVREEGKLKVTHLFVVLLLVETSDVMFALDSIPAVFSVTQDPFIVYTSNIFAILGLRSLYFMVSGVMELFIHLKTAVALILAFVGVKMLLPLYGKVPGGHEIHIPIEISLGVIVFLLAGSIIISLPHYLKTKETQNEN